MAGIGVSFVGTASFRVAHAQQADGNCIAGCAWAEHPASFLGASRGLRVAEPGLSAVQRGQEEDHPDGDLHVVHVLTSEKTVKNKP